MSEIDKELPVYPIGVVRRLTGLTSRQIRYYEQEGLLSPVRSKGNRRLYTTGDIDRLSTVKNLLAEGLNLEGVRAWLERHSDTAHASPVIKPVTPVPVPSKRAEPLHSHPTPPDDHSIHFGESRVGGTLTSLFPVNDQGALTRRLQSDSYMENKET